MFLKSLLAVAMAASCVLVSASAAADPLKVLFLGADTSLDRVKSDILGADTRFDLNGSATFNPGNAAPTLAYLQQFDAVLAWTNWGMAAGSGDVMADYVDAGGHVVLSTFIGQHNSYSNLGRIMSTGYSPFTGVHYAYSGVSLGAYDSTHQLFAGVNTVASSRYNSDWSGLDTGARLIASWDNLAPFVGINAAGNVIDISLFPNVATHRHATGDYQQLYRNALAYEEAVTAPADVPEPASLALLGVGLAALAASRRKRGQGYRA